MGRYAMDAFLTKPRYAKFKELANYNDGYSDSPRKVLNEAAFDARTKKLLVPTRIQSLIKTIPNKAMTRDELYAYVNRPETSMLKGILTILGWGDIQPKNFRSFANKETKFLAEALKDIAKSQLSQSEAYEKIKSLKKGSSKHWKLYGLGPAYYTKLLYFYTKEKKHTCYIMDQFTARSMNFLCYKNEIPLTEDGNVDKSNTGEIYERFCLRIEAISRNLKAEGKKVEPENVEFALFGKDSDWRTYLTTNDMIARRRR